MTPSMAVGVMMNFMGVLVQTPQYLVLEIIVLIFDTAGRILVMAQIF